MRVRLRDRKLEHAVTGPCSTSTVCCYSDWFVLMQYSVTREEPQQKYVEKLPQTFNVYWFSQLSSKHLPVEALSHAPVYAGGKLQKIFFKSKPQSIPDSASYIHFCATSQLVTEPVRLVFSVLAPSAPSHPAAQSWAHPHCEPFLPTSVNKDEREKKNTLKIHSGDWKWLTIPKWQHSCQDHRTIAGHDLASLLLWCSW